MNNREISEKIRDHLTQQKAKATFEGFCRYRGDYGTSCAVGCLIPDEAYLPELEGQPLEPGARIWPVVQNLYPGVSPKLLREWQLYHDGWGGNNYEYWISGVEHSVSPAERHEQLMLTYGGEQ